MTPNYAARLAGLRSLVGNTPLLAIAYRFEGQSRVLYAKAEHLNLSGSIKDRMALHILRSAYDRGELKPGAPIIEATSGNTGISFAAIGRALGHPVSIFMPDWMSEERRNLLRSYGARIHLVSRDQGGFEGAIAGAEALAAVTPGAFLPRQFANEDNSDAHVAGTGPEIWAQVTAHDMDATAFVAGVGTGGTVMGVGRHLRQHWDRVRIHPVEPANSPTLSTGTHKGSHRIQGISDEFIPPIVHLSELDEVIAVDDGDAIRMAQRLASELGLGVGISSGANFLAAAKLQDELGSDAVVVTVFADDNKKYLSTALLRDEPAREDHLTDVIALDHFRAWRRSCRTCFADDRAVAAAEAWG
jgi:cysteine synthase A